MKKLLITLVFLMGLASQGFCQSDSDQFILSVASSLKITTPKFLPRGNVGQPYAIAFTASGGVAPYTWTTSTNQGQTGLPLGLALSADGIISGTISPSACIITEACQYSFTITVVDASGITGKLTVKSNMEKDL